MAKGYTGVIALIIIIVIIGSAAGYYFYFYEPEGKEEKPPEVEINEPPIAIFTFENGTSARVNELVWFNANGSSDKDGDIIRYEWNFGDGEQAFSNGTRINHSYLSPGEFNVNLTVVDDDNGRDTVIKTMTIRQTDYSDGAVAILLSREPAGYPDETNRTIPVDKFAVSLTINITFMGLALDGSSITEAELEVLILNPFGFVIGNLTDVSRIQEANLDFYFDSNDLVNDGTYEMIATCNKGSLRLSYEIDVLY